MPSARHYSGACPPIPRLTYLPLQRWQFLCRVLSYVWDTSNLLCQKLFCNITIEVHDTGPSILPHNRDKIFTPYFSTKKHGTGLGFSFVQYIVVAHHSPIVLVTEDAILGVTFRIELSLNSRKRFVYRRRSDCRKRDPWEKAGS